MNSSIITTTLTLYGQFREIALKYPNRKALHFLGCTMDYEELLSEIGKTAAAFYCLGISKGSKVALCLPNSPQLVISLYALNCIGAVAVLIHPLSPPNELLVLLTETESDYVIVLDLFIKNYSSIQVFCPLVKKVICVSLMDYMRFSLKAKYALFTFPSLVSSFLENRKVRPLKWIDLMKLSSCEPLCAASDIHADAIILFSGGTSAKPKAVVHSSSSINASALQSIATEPPIEEDMSMLAILPVFHIFGLTVSLHIAFLAGGECILVPKYDQKAIVSLIIDKKPNYIAGVPTIFNQLLQDNRLKKASQNGKLDLNLFRLAFCGGDTVTKSVQSEFSKLLQSNGGVGILAAGYGLTECCPVTVMPRDTEYNGSLGKPFPGISLCIVKPGTIEVLPSAAEGEICVNAPSVMKGYFNNEIETKKALQVHHDGRIWLHTGDLGSLDEDGFLFFHGRLQRLIKVSGYSVYACYVEEILEAHPLVKKACIVAIPDAKSINRLKAYIIPVCPKNYKSQFDTSQLKKIKGELQTYCSNHLKPWAIPSSIEFRDKFPKNILGKTSWGKIEEEETFVSSSK